MTAFWDIAPCSLVEVHRRLRGAYCSIIRAMNLKKLTSLVVIQISNELISHIQDVGWQTKCPLLVL
jgi:hypothetical protein